VIFRDGFSEHAKALCESVGDWDQIFFGGQHVMPSQSTDNPDIRKCVKCQRTHAYAVSARGAATLLPLLEVTETHVDVLYARAQYDGLIKAYAPSLWLCGQGPGTSDVFGSKQPARTVENYWDEVA